MIVTVSTAFVFSNGERTFANSASGVLNQSPLRQAIIVVRHGLDQQAPNPCVSKDAPGKLSDDWKAIAPNWPKHEGLPGVRSFNSKGEVTELDAVKTLQHCLSKEGEQQALRLSDELPAILNNQNLAPVSRVIVINPTIITSNGDWSTANPFDTVLPFILKNKDSIKSILLLCNNGCKMVGQMSTQLLDLVDNHALLDPVNGGSTLVCWTGEGLNETKDNQPALLERLTSQSVRDNINIKNSPCIIGGKSMGYEKGKGSALYIYTPRPYSAKTDVNGTIGAMKSVNPNCPDQKYDLLVYQAMCKSTESPTNPAIANFHPTHKFVVNEIPPGDELASAFVTREFNMPADTTLSGEVMVRLNLSY